MMGNKNVENSLSNDDYVMKENIGNNYSQLDNEMLLKRKFDKVEVQSITEEEKIKESENPNKKSKVSRDHGPKNKKNSQPKAKKNQKNIQMNTEEVGDKETNNNGQSTSCCSSEDDSNLKTKTRASRGAATDPQSLYARVDLSTMLEEAVHYVKFLQTQIKLLSSDDMWMYAPIAYNGMGLDL
uniref:Helix-loop-helix DNA-binding domain containing protein n=1 Tax=Solanum tuberosum TaxID=4113 RepID=M1ATU1_SOLTU